MAPLIPKGIVVKENSLAIVGWDDGGCGQVQAWLESSLNWHVACFVNPEDHPPRVDVETERKKRDAKRFDFPTCDSFKGRPLISSLQWAELLPELGIRKALVMTGDSRERWKHIQQARDNRIELIKAIHPSVLIMEEAEIHDNVIIFPRAVIGYRAEVYSGVLINTGAQVEHHNVIRECAIFDPGVVTAGNVTVERFARVHTGAVIKNRIRVGEGAIIGAGSVIIRDVPPRVTVVGVPGRIIKYHEGDEPN